jgi:hypothetical protein
VDFAATGKISLESGSGVGRSAFEGIGGRMMKKEDLFQYIY